MTKYQHQYHQPHQLTNGNNNKRKQLRNLKQVSSNSLESTNSAKVNQPFRKQHHHIDDNHNILHW